MPSLESRCKFSVFMHVNTAANNGSGQRLQQYCSGMHTNEIKYNISIS